MTRSEPNAYGRQLTAGEIAAGEHRAFVGGLWDEIGALQLEFLRARGLEPHHHLLDIGCGALRGGIPVIRYLDPGRYCGFDINASLIEAARVELSQAGLEGKAPQLLVEDGFEAARFGRLFDFAIAQSVFTHLPMNDIIRCLVQAARVLSPGARLYATYFEAPTAAHLQPVRQEPGGIVTQYGADPYHYALAEMRWMAGLAGLELDALGDWGHPRGQRMLALHR